MHLGAPPRSTTSRLTAPQLGLPYLDAFLTYPVLYPDLYLFTSMSIASSDSPDSTTSGLIAFQCILV